MRHEIPLGRPMRLPPMAKALIIFLFGGVGYGLIELLWRGRTHPSMVLTGGFCFAIICGINFLFAMRGSRTSQHRRGILRGDARQSPMADGRLGLFGREAPSARADLSEIHRLVVHALASAFHGGLTSD